MDWKAWLRQPTTITGLATVAGGLLAGLTQLAFHDSGATATLGGVAFAAVHLLVNDNSVATDARKLSIDLLDGTPVKQDALTAIADGLSLTGAGAPSVAAQPK